MAAQNAPPAVQRPKSLPGQANAAPEKEVPPGAIEGQVLNIATGEPLKKASLVLTPTQPRQGPIAPYSTTSDANGQFTIKDVKPGSYMLMAERNGFVRSSYGARGPGQQGSTLTVSSGETIKAISVRLQPHGVISGRILDEDGEPVAHVQVQAMSRRYVQGRRQLTVTGGGSTNDLGEYRIFGLAPGRYYISAILHRSGFGRMGQTSITNPNEPEEDYAPTYYPGSNEAASAAPIVIAAGQPVGNIDIKLHKTQTVRVRGQVTGNAGPGRTMVMLSPRDSSLVGMFDRNMSAPQSRDGKFEIRGVIPGSYYLTAQTANDGNRYVARVPVNVGNSNVEGVELTLKPGMDIAGTVSVEGQTKIDVSQLNVSLQSKEFVPMGGGGGSRVKEDGTFLIHGIFPDTYRVAAFAGGQAFYLKSVLAGQQEAKNGEVTVVDGAPPTLTIVLSSAGGQVGGSVLNDKKEPAHGSTVVLLPSADRRDQPQYYKSATVDQNGKFTMTGVAPGDYTLLAWENVESGAWLDPEFVARFETNGKALHIKDNDVVSAEIQALKAEDSASGAQ
jgi:hypothetical protein